jgi:hypothetical protein
MQEALAAPQKKIDGMSQVLTKRVFPHDWVHGEMDTKSSHLSS